ncbi:unnamed protein product [Paramecium octaurelia]|uniref:Uncharacterized protein n=1 Tax=Paramecium octaurelia TaxID=43137 RepID=A0A8S1WTN3_PAROT|nr:unnamed protein product [Paramecium octaurelia]
MNFLNKIFASTHNRSSFLIEDVLGSEDDQGEVPERQEIPQFKKQSIQHYRITPQETADKMGLADFLARYDENFEDVFVVKPKGKKRRQEEGEYDNERNHKRKNLKAKQGKLNQKNRRNLQKIIPKEQQATLDYQEFQVTIDYNDLNDMTEFKKSLKSKLEKDPKIRLPKFPKYRKRIAKQSSFYFKIKLRWT